MTPPESVGGTWAPGVELIRGGKVTPDGRMDVTAVGGRQARRDALRARVHPTFSSNTNMHMYMLSCCTCGRTQDQGTIQGTMQIWGPLFLPYHIVNVYC